MKKLYRLFVAFLLCTSLILNSEIVPFSTALANEAEDTAGKITSELLDYLELTAEDLTRGNYSESGLKTKCIVWTEDVDYEPAIKYGIDQAEKTRPEPVENYKYPYEVYYTESGKDVVVDIPDDENNLYVQTYIEAKRKYIKEEYNNNNQKLKGAFDAEGIEAEYISRFSPCIFSHLTVTDICKLMNYDCVIRIGLWELGDAKDAINSDGTFDSNDLSKLNDMLEFIRVDEAKDVYDVDGNGIKIGQCESGCPSSSSVNKRPGTSIITAHAGEVYTIMHEIAPRATYYAAGIDDSSYEECMEWLAERVNIINISWGDSDTVNQYYEMDHWTDHIAYNHDVHVVIASGNSDIHGVSSPAMSLNAITVGLVYHYGTFSRVSSNSNKGSSYNNFGPLRTSNRTYKPDIMAAGVFDYAGDIWGTSYAAPMISGVLALMCDLQSSLNTKQHIAKSIITCTTSKTTRRYDTENSHFIEYGSGIVDARSALYAVNNGHYSSSTGTVSTTDSVKTYSMTVTSSDTWMRVALAYANRIKFSGDDHSMSGTPSGTIGELKLEVFSPNGTLVKSCTINGANLKILGFNPTSFGTGTYTIKVTQTTSASGGRVTNFGVCWR